MAEIIRTQSFLLSALLLLSVFSIITLLSVNYFVSTLYAANAENTQLGSSVTVNSFVDTSMNISDLPFGNQDPNTQDANCTCNPSNYTNTANSNTAIDVYFNNTNMTSGANVISYINLSVATGNTPTQSRAFNGSSYINQSAVNSGYIENLTRDNSTQLFWFLDIPAGQTAGLYNGTVVIKGVQDGVAP